MYLFSLQNDYILLATAVTTLLYHNIFHKPEERRKVGGLLLQSRNDGLPYPLLCGRGPLPDLLAVMQETALAMELWMLDHGQVIFQTYPVREPPQSPRRPPEVPEFPSIVQRDRIVINVVMDMFFIRMGGNEKGVFALCPAHGRFIAYPVCLLRGNLPGGKGLADLIAEHIRLPLLFPARDSLVLCFGEQELGIGGLMVALIGRNKLPALGFLQVLSIVQTILERFCNRFSLADMMGD